MRLDRWVVHCPGHHLVWLILTEVGIALRTGPLVELHQGGDSLIETTFEGSPVAVLTVISGDLLILGIPAVRATSSVLLATEDDALYAVELVEHDPLTTSDLFPTQELPFRETVPDHLWRRLQDPPIREHNLKYVKLSPELRGIEGVRDGNKGFGEPLCRDFSERALLIL